LDIPSIFSPSIQTDQSRYCTRGHAKGKVLSILDYSTISRRINSFIYIKKEDDKSNRFKDNYIVIAIVR
jgi:hypothetical protein